MTLRALALATLLLVWPAAAAAPIEGLILPNRQSEVCAPVASRILELKVGEGEAVKAGQTLALLDGKLEELEMKRAKLLLERREFEAKSTQRLYDSRILPEARALETRIELELARLHYETAVQQVRLRTVVAPMDGVVVARSREVGESVSSAQPLFRIQDLSRVLVQCAVAPETLGALKPGQKLRVQLLPLAPGGIFEGEVVLVAVCADSEGKVQVKVAVENPDRRIRPGLRAQVELP
jgi:membrane fusion protein, multidrug efflux system